MYMYNRQLVKQFKIQFFNFTEVHATGTSNAVGWGRDGGDERGRKEGLRGKGGGEERHVAGDASQKEVGTGGRIIHRGQQTLVILLVYETHHFFDLCFA